MDIDARTKRYLIQMTIRTVCFVLAVFVFSGWARLAAVAAAVVLPFVSVVGANAGPTPTSELPEYYHPDTGRALEAGPSRETPEG